MERELVKGATSTTTTKDTIKKMEEQVKYLKEIADKFNIAGDSTQSSNREAGSNVDALERQLSA